MDPVRIQRIAIDEADRLVIRPDLAPTQSLEFVYRAGMGVYWDDQSRVLYCPRPKDWSYARWFNQAVVAVASEYRLQLTIAASTEWVNVPDEVRAAIQKAASLTSD